MFMSFWWILHNDDFVYLRDTEDEIELDALVNQPMVSIVLKLFSLFCLLCTAWRVRELSADESVMLCLRIQPHDNACSYH